MLVERVEALKTVLHKLSDEAFAYNNRPMTTLYVDMAALYDYKLTALLQLITHDIEYQYILSQLDKYELAADRLICKHFPALKLQEGQITSWITNPDNHIVLANAAIATTLLKLIPTIIQGFIHNNNMLPHVKNPTITIYLINPYFLPDVKFRQKLTAALRTIYPNLRVVFRQQDIAYEDKSLLDTVDQFIVDNIQYLSETQGTFHDLLYKDKAFIKKAILATELFDSNLDGTTILDDDRHKIFHNTSEAYGIFTNLYFLKKQIMKG
jgi:hypothetical protein